MIPREQLRRADIFASSLLILFGASVAAGALRMPITGDYGGRPLHWYTSPAFLPLALGILLAALSAGTLVRAVRQGGHTGCLHRLLRAFRSLPASRTARRILLVWALIGVYILLISLHPFAGLSGPLRAASLGKLSLTAFLTTPEGCNYAAASFVFLVAFMLAFHRRGGGGPVRRAAWIVLLSLAVSWGVGYVFTQHLYAPLPWLDYDWPT